VSRLGRGWLTGIDRVELAYLRRFQADAVPFFALVRTPVGFVLLDRDGARHVLARATGRAAAGPGDPIGRLLRRRAPDLGRDEADLRRLALGRCLPPFLAGILRHHLPRDTDCYLVGHANLSAPVLAALGRGGGRVVVLLHDTIPLDRPDLTAPGTPARFAARLGAVAARADLVLFSTRDAAARALPHLAQAGRTPPALVAPLGVEPLLPDPAAVPAHLFADDRPAFLALGTIEPRKNHALLLDLWEDMHATMPDSRIPRLILAGARGWSNEAVFRRLDTRPHVGRTVVECPGLGDGAIASLMDRCEALLFPSLTEGFGLPPVEAAARGLPVIASPLPALRETLGDYPDYLEPANHGAWLRAILECADQARRPEVAARSPRRVPTWADHFNLVLSHR
jgi:glycosyltransferase involved in cell wall biosynthesis